MGVQIALIWDYDTPTGFDVSHLSREADPMSEYVCTDRILRLFAAHNIISTFACVGKSAEAGPLPYHNPVQIRQIHAMGHEIASHSHRHELIPTLTQAELEETLRRSRETLEDCIGAPVVGFVPPWNRPFHHPQKFSFSYKDWRDGGGRWRHSVATLCRTLADCDYQWLRVGYSGMMEKVRVRLNPALKRQPGSRPISQNAGVACLPISYLGYDEKLRNWIEAHYSENPTLIVYSHPHGIEHENAQHWRHLQSFVAWITERRADLDLSFVLPRDLIKEN